MDIKETTLLLDKNKVLMNIERMSVKARAAGVQFRPHFKTSQSRSIGAWFKTVGVEKITVSSFKMAMYFAEAGWGDITVAFPCNILEIERINALAARIKLHILVESVEVLVFLKKHLERDIGIFMKIDTGYGRTGISAQDLGQIDALLAVVKTSPLMTFKGFLSHFGHTYKVRGRTAIQTIFEEGNRRLAVLESKYKAEYSNLEISIGDTPTCSVLNDFGVATEIRPGNFVFYDLMQWQIGACALEDIAVALACPVVAKHDSRKELIIQGGGVHLSKDQICHLKTGEVYYGMAFPLKETGWDLSVEPSIVRNLSQEHGIVKATNSFYESIKIGDLVAVLPIHSCMAANLMKSYLSLDGERITMMP